MEKLAGRISKDTLMRKADESGLALSDLKILQNIYHAGTRGKTNLPGTIQKIEK